MSGIKNGLFTGLLAVASLMPVFSNAQPPASGDPKSGKTEKIIVPVYTLDPNDPNYDEVDDYAQDGSLHNRLAFVVYLGTKDKHRTDGEVANLLQTKTIPNVKRDYLVYVDRETNTHPGVLVRAYYNGGLKYQSFLTLSELKNQQDNINNRIFIDIKPESTALLQPNN